MAASHEIQYFLGANSPAGFYSLYSELLSPETANAIYILKGGPGCGKSTLMRRVAQQAAQALEILKAAGEQAYQIGQVVSGEAGVELV